MSERSLEPPSIPRLFLLIGPLMINPVATLLWIRVLAPGFRFDQSFGPVNDLELAVLENFTDQHRLMRVLIGFIHHDLAAWRQELLPIDRLTHLVDFNGTSLLNRLLPHIDAEICGLDRIVGDSVFSIR